VLAVGGAAAYWFAIPLRQWIRPSTDPALLVVSGNIEAHESVIGFKTVQSRIVELPFDEGQWVKTGALLARVESLDYRQQVVIAQAALDAQRRQLAVAEQNVESNKRTVISDEADLELKQLEFDRAQALLAKGAGTMEARDQARAASKQSSAALDRDRALE